MAKKVTDNEQDKSLESFNWDNETEFFGIQSEGTPAQVITDNDDDDDVDEPASKVPAEKTPAKQNYEKVRSISPLVVQGASCNFYL